MLPAQAQTASLVYRHGGNDYLLNLIDTPGHVGARAAAAKTHGLMRRYAHVQTHCEAITQVTGGG